MKNILLADIDLGKINWSPLQSKFTGEPAAVVAAIITWLLGFAGALAVIAIVWSGVMYITAGGDPTKAESAKKNLIWAITGVVVILLAYVIIQWVGNILNYGTTTAPNP